MINTCYGTAARYLHQYPQRTLVHSFRFQNSSHWVNPNCNAFDKYRDFDKMRGASNHIRLMREELQEVVTDPSLQRIDNFLAEHSAKESFDLLELHRPAMHGLELHEYDNRDYGSPTLWLILKGTGLVRATDQSNLAREEIPVEPGTFLEIPASYTYNFFEQRGEDPILAIKVLRHDPRNCCIM